MRAEPLEDLFLLAAYASLEADEVRKPSSAPIAPSAPVTPGPGVGGDGKVKTETRVIQYRLKPS